MKKKRTEISHDVVDLLLPLWRLVKIVIAKFQNTFFYRICGKPFRNNLFC